MKKKIIVIVACIISFVILLQIYIIDSFDVKPISNFKLSLNNYAENEINSNTNRKSQNDLSTTLDSKVMEKFDKFVKVNKILNEREKMENHQMEIPIENKPFMDSLYSFVKSGSIYYVELPYSYNFGKSSVKYPGTRHLRRFLSIKKDNWEAYFIDSKGENHLISEKSYSYRSSEGIQVSPLDNIQLKRINQITHYLCAYFRFEVKLREVGFIEKAKWFLSSEYGIEF